LKRLLWALFGNDDEHPNPPTWYWPTQPLWWRHVKWWLRNPGHNFVFYVIGVAGKPFERIVVYPRGAPSNLVFRPNGWYVAYIKYKTWRLPFVSYQGRYAKWYVGVRERGGWGMKFNLRIAGYW